MNKTEIIDRIAEQSGINKTQAKSVLDSIIDNIKAELKSGGSVVIPGFGTFTVKDRAAREGRNPQTGETIQIKACKRPAFKAGKTFKDALN
jgi:DNA-binding protein HU-beta